MSANVEAVNTSPCGPQLLVVVGAGGFGREVAWLAQKISARDSRWQLLGFVDDDPCKSGQLLNGLPVLGGTAWLTGCGLGKLCVAIAVGDPASKRRLVRRLSGTGVGFATLIDPNARLSPSVEVGEGTIVCASTVVTVDVLLGKFVGVNPGCTVGHDTVLGDYCSLMPGVNIAGNVTLGEGTYVGTGTGAAVIQGITIGPWSVIGPGAVVTRDMPPNVVAVSASQACQDERRRLWLAHIRGA